LLIPQPLIEPTRQANWLAPYWEGLEVRELRLPQCSACGQWEWYPLVTGPSGCPGSHYVWKAVSPLATVFTFTHVHRPLIPGAIDPYWVGLVLPDDAPNCRVAARLLTSGEEVNIGSRARLRFAPAGDHPYPYFAVEPA
jgi:uncharacterized OB-fold protein